jgi:hypothetical protein
MDGASRRWADAVRGGDRRPRSGAQSDLGGCWRETPSRVERRRRVAARRRVDRGHRRADCAHHDASAARRRSGRHAKHASRIPGRSNSHGYTGNRSLGRRRGEWRYSACGACGAARSTLQRARRAAPTGAGAAAYQRPQMVPATPLHAAQLNGQTAVVQAGWALSEQLFSRQRLWSGLRTPLSSVPYFIVTDPLR